MFSREKTDNPESIGTLYVIEIERNEDPGYKPVLKKFDILFNDLTINLKEL